MPSEALVLPSEPPTGPAPYTEVSLNRTPSQRAEEITMSHLPLLLIVWAVLAACFLALLAYRGQLTRYEEDQLFLGDNHSNEQDEQSEIIRKVNKIRPMVNLFGYAAALATIGIVGLFTYDAWQHLR